MACQTVTATQKWAKIGHEIKTIILDIKIGNINTYL